MYQGHHKDGSSIQNHSAGAHYPYVIGKYERPELSWFVLAPNGDQAEFQTGNAAVRFAEAAAPLYH
jgi:hypothetical protein